jgi:Protein of unknown function (DUF3551)
MKNLVFAGVLAAASIGWQTSASAYERAYCMEIAYGGGGSTIDCSYDTFEQCLKWKVDISSTCSRNPRWVPDPRRNRRPLR